MHFELWEKTKELLRTNQAKRKAHSEQQQDSPASASLSPTLALEEELAQAEVREAKMKEESAKGGM